jgi:PAS domain S-box-containing protein
MPSSKPDHFDQGPVQSIEPVVLKDSLFASLMAALPYAAVIVTPEGRLGFISDQTTKIFGYRRDELIGRPIEVLIPQRFREAHTVHRAEYAAKPMTRPMGIGLELSGRRKNGAEFPVEISISPVRIQGQDFVIALIQDITHRKRTGDALRASEELFRAMTKTSPVGIFRTDVHGNGIYLNERGCNIVGLTSDEAKGTGWMKNLHPDDRERVFAEWSRTVHDGKSFRSEHRFCHADGKTVWVFAQVEVELGPKGEILGYVGTLTDITEHKQMEESLRKRERRFRDLSINQERQLILSDRLISFGEVTASLAHEFNNPLGIVIGFAQDLLTELDPEDSRYQSVKIIEEEARRCKKIMQDLLDFGRQTPPQHTQTDLAEIVRKNIEMISPRLFKAGIRSVFEDPGGLPKIWADPQQFGQVLVNLFFNAVESMPNGGKLTVGIAARPHSMAGDPVNDPAPPDDVIITVSDTGQGIQPAHLSKIFLPFFTTKSKKGMGLGLSICKSIVEAHHGKISVESTPGRGTTFSLYLPADPRRQAR